jgi:glycosyltransferase involved in cell wall biosynthesis
VLNDLSNFTLVIPCYNEAQALESLLASCKKCVLKTGVNIVLVDNGSIDSSWEILQKNHGNNISSIRLLHNIGYGNGVIRGMQEGKSVFIGWIHADQGYILDNLHTVNNFSLQENSFLKGLRVNRPLRDTVISKLMAAICSAILRVNLYEINAQPTFYPIGFIKKQPSPPNDFGFDLYFYYKAKINGLTEIRISMNYQERQYGESRWNYGIRSMLGMGYKVIKTAYKMKGK